MKNRFAAEINEGESLRDIFLVTRKDTRETKHGKPYLALELADSSGKLAGRVWERADRYGGQFGVGDYVKIDGRAESFQGVLQLNINHIEKLDPHSVNPTQFLPTVSEDVEQLYAELLEILERIEDQGLKQLAKDIFTDGEVSRMFRRAPAAQSVHHAKLGGLLQHTVSMLLLALKFCEHYTMLDRDLLIAGVALHDIGKIDELAYERTLEYTVPGKLVGHITMGLERIDKAAEKTKIDNEALLQLKHIVLSHHGEREFGSPVLPATPEALLIHFLDNIDSKLNLLCNQIEAEIDEPGGFTSWNRYMERSFYKGKHAQFTPYGVNWPWADDETRMDSPKSARQESKKHSAQKKDRQDADDQGTPSLFDKKRK